MNIFDYSVSDLEEASESLLESIEELEEMKVKEHENMIDTVHYVRGEAVGGFQAQHARNIEEIDKLIDFLEEIDSVIDEFKTTMEDGLKPNADLIKVNPKIIGNAVNGIEEAIEDGNCYNAIVKEGNMFDLWQLQAESDLVHITKEDREEQDEYRYCKTQLENLNDELHSNYKEIEGIVNDLTIEYRFIFEDLEDNEWIKGLVRDLEMDDFDFSEFSEVNVISQGVSISNNLRDTIYSERKDFDDSIKEGKLTFDTGVKALDNILSDKASELRNMGYSDAELNKLVHNVMDTDFFKFLDFLGRASEAYDLAVTIADVESALYEQFSNGFVTYETMKKLIGDSAGTLVGDGGEVAGAAIAAYFSAGIAAPIGAALGDILLTEISKKGLEYVYSCIWSEGVDGGIVLDAEVVLFREKLEAGEFEDISEVINNFSDIFI